MTYGPREDTYFLRDYVERQELEGKKVLEMGTGSGAVAVAAAKKGAEVTAVDVDAAALEDAERLAVKEGVGDRIEFVESDLFENVDGRFDLLVFNPPYLPDEDGLDDRAVFGGETGVELSERFVGQAEEHRREGGTVAVVASSRADIDRLEDAGLEQADSRKIWFETLYVLEK